MYSIIADNNRTGQSKLLATTTDPNRANTLQANWAALQGDDITVIIVEQTHSCVCGKWFSKQTHLAMHLMLAKYKHQKGHESV
jgi:hypothetical protein